MKKQFIIVSLHSAHFHNNLGATDYSFYYAIIKEFHPLKNCYEFPKE
jgi:hypothetical protein